MYFIGFAYGCCIKDNEKRNICDCGGFSRIPVKLRIRFSFLLSFDVNYGLNDISFEYIIENSEFHVLTTLVFTKTHLDKKIWKRFLDIKILFLLRILQTQYTG